MWVMEWTWHILNAYIFLKCISQMEKVFCFFFVGQLDSGTHCSKNLANDA
jgi:hypothetical protein